ncbi:unnamed protein product [Allacma fusca]|uniref:Uncharacterized protein n=1 Tax=Allacma fusca TaxID=39272 RepID=A0A8J2LLC3_9HEXA|nr:unnamed protein product [Allacma fusca]
MDSWLFLDKSSDRVRSKRTTNNLKDSWRSSRSMDWDPMLETSFSRNPAMTYCYTSSSEDSLGVHDNGKESLSCVSIKKTDLEAITSSKVPSIPPRTPNFRGSAIRNSTVTPPPCVLRKIRHKYSASSTPRSSKDYDGDDSLAFLAEVGGGARRTSSGSSLSTLTAEPRTTFSRHISFSSLQRPPKNHQEETSIMSSSNESNIYQTIKNGSLTRGSSSTNASPLMHPQRHHPGNSPGPGRSYSRGHSNSLGHNNIGNQKVKGNFSLEKNLEAIKLDLGEISFEMRQLDVDVSSLRQDVGSVQENIATVRGTLAVTSERVARLGNQVCAIERQVGNVIKDVNTMRDRALKLMEEAETSKATHLHLQEEAENLVSFLRQMTHGCCNQQGQHLGPTLRNHCCSGLSKSNHQSHGALINSNNVKNQQMNSNGGSSGGHTRYCPTPAPRKSKTPERTLDDEDGGLEGAENVSKLETSSEDRCTIVHFSDEMRTNNKAEQESDEDDDDDDTKSEISLLAEF